MNQMLRIFWGSIVQNSIPRTVRINHVAFGNIDKEKYDWPEQYGCVYYIQEIPELLLYYTTYFTAVGLLFPIKIACC